MSKDLQPVESQFLMYTSPKGEVKIEVVFEDETVWLSQKKMGELFNVEVNTINYHLKEIFKTHELDENSVIRKIRITATDGKQYLTNFYNLDAIIAVGYRVNSFEATQFRIWATQTLREFIIKGFALDDERLKNGAHFGKDYFRELLERIRSIRASERRIYQQITDIFAQCSIDYDKNSDITQNFYAMVQNKFHYAITGQTAAEIVHSSVDSTKPHMGLKTWKRSPDGPVNKSDTTVAKNYLDELDIKKLERLVTGFFDYLERLIENETLLKMEDLAKSVGEFLAFNKYEILDGSGRISHARAEKRAHAEYERFKLIQDRTLESDFDRVVNKALKKGKTISRQVERPNVDKRPTKSQSINGANDSLSV